MVITVYNEQITLVKLSQTKNELGDTVESQTERTIFCGVKSIGQSEFYQAAANGFKPELKFVIADYYDYDDEQEVIYQDKRYSVLRTYRSGTELEIVVHRGVNINERPQVSS